MAKPPRGASQDASTRGQRPLQPVPTRWKWTLQSLKVMAAGLVLGLVAVAAVVGIGYSTTDIPDKGNAEFETATSFVYYNNGKSQLGSFAIQNRQPLTFAEMPQTIKDAVVAAENRSFWTDRGVSIRGMARAAWVIGSGGDLQGGSTITQQYIKILYLTQEQTLTRKFKELFIAYKINKERSKEQILEGYLNTIYFGRGAYGIQAASESYFDVDAKELTVPQAAVLASVVNNPSLFDPSVDESNIERLRGRYGYVIASMAETGAITAEQAAEYSKKLPTFPNIPTNDRYGGPKGFLLKLVERELAAEGFDASRISGGGLQITTTFDKQAQDAAVKSAQKYTKQAANAVNKKASNLHAAVASVEVGTGAVLALYGGPDFVKNSRNWATTARPTASTFKTYALAAGLKDGYSLRSTFNGNTFTPPGDTSTVRNEYSIQYGRYVSLVRATAESINTAFVDLITSMDDGPKKVAEMAEAAGAPKGDGWELNSRIPLGAAEVSPLNQAGAYATYANEGVAVDNHVVKEVRDRNGKLLYKANPEEKRAVSEGIAADVTYALRNVVEEGTGRTVQTLNRPVAGKTGTKDGDKDDITSAWFVAYTKQISTAVMYVAGNSGSADLDAYARPGDSTFFGATYPALTWADYMETATKGQPVKQFDDPAYVNADSAPQSQPTATRTQRAEPTETEEPSDEPTETQSQEPSETPSRKPTQTQSQEPTESSSPTATRRPTQQPTDEPSDGERSQQPTVRPTGKTTREPTSSAPTSRSTSGNSSGGTTESGGGAGGGDSGGGPGSGGDNRESTGAGDSERTPGGG
ncbi:MAG: Multimodular transpeptidase-transglycosylase [uncultured Propionibacteriaceae bacterium]|uniref:Multimodular transpeptidase-transglycosylase n=1 Tax=uncultured Propionibacteriaceae bacterium TaxID=257457 RepID=A0A6J4NBM0_9ACTN|nr:MAG: Multimodular transpeptidase-transglycosylase [uncultured Propionibacteriaceae bacterium]